MTPVVVACELQDKVGPYFEAALAGGVPRQEIVVVTPGERSAEELRSLAAGACGLVLCGGDDIDPRRYGEEPLPHGRLQLRAELDEMDIALLAGAREGRTPVWGVCRGMQVINVFLGGSLWQDLPLQWPGAGLHDLSFPRDLLVHAVEVRARETALGRLLSDEPPLVNSRHHQAVKQIAPGLVPVAWAPDGVLEVLEGSDPGWWLRAVQWHPENLLAMPLQRELWRAFAAAAAAAGNGGAEKR